MTQSAKRDDGKAVIKDGAEQIETVLPEGVTRADLLATITFSSIERNTLSARGFAGRGFKTTDVEFNAATKAVAKMCGKVREGNLDVLTDMLTSQALTLDSMFTEYSRCAVNNLGQYPEAVDRYTNLAIKAQTQCRTTIETLARVKRGGKQIVKVVHVHEGGQAVVADTFNNGGHRGAAVENDEQPHDQGAPVAALPGQDPSRDGVPVPCPSGKEKVPVARGALDGGSEW